MVHDLAFASINEQRSKRRWGIFFKLIMMIYIGVVIALVAYPLDSDLESLNKSHTALIEVEGVIASDSAASADKIVSSLRDAFKDKKTKGVILRMNTPGGSPVQSGYINDEIYRLKKKYPDIPVYAVISDVCASGGYYIAAAADEIYADKASIVGSIGVVMNGFGFVDAMKTLGISRRLYTAGEHKAFLDPFSPQDGIEVKHINSMLKNIHEQFIAVVKKGRGDKLNNDPNLFSGYFWTGEKAITMGLVDKLGSASYVAREVIGEERIKEFSHEDDLLERLSKRLGAAVSIGLMKIMGAPTIEIR
ncbi:MAG: S49 family peptidase [Pseudomonadota bacterium]